MDPSPVLGQALEQLNTVTGQVHHLLKGMEEIQNELEARSHAHEALVAEKDQQMKVVKSQLDERKIQYETLKEEMEKQVEAAKKLEGSGGGGQGGTATSLMNKEEKEELIELRREVAEYEMEFKTLKNQDITIKKLNQQIESLIESQEDELQKELK